MQLRTLLATVTATITMLATAAACTTDVDGSVLDGRGDETPPRVAESNATGATSTQPTKTGLPCEVDAVLKTRCQTCHGSTLQYGAPNPLVTYDDLAKASGSGKVLDRVLARMKDEARPMPPVPNPPVPAKDLAALEDWVGAGAKRSPDVCTNKAPEGGVKPLSCKPDTILQAPRKFKLQPGGELDQYVCFGVDVQLAKKRHVVALAPHTDNKKILHHILLFQSPRSVSSDPTPCSAAGSATWKLVAGWAPGGENVELPAEAGYPEEVGATHWVLQLHYNNALNTAGEEDQSGYELCTTESLRANDAGVLAFGSVKFSIPPRSTTTISCDYKLPSTFKNTKFFNASPHMHTRGAAMSTEHLAGGTGAPTKILDQPAFDFANQANYPVTGTVNAGDVIRTRCTWKNPEAATIGFGEGTGDEMCFNFISYYPNIPDKTMLGLPLFTWVTPSASAQCTAQ